MKIHYGARQHSKYVDRISKHHFYLVNDPQCKKGIVQSIKMYFPQKLHKTNSLGGARVQLDDNPYHQFWSRNLET